MPTLAAALASQGYRTMAVVANYGYLGPGFGLDRGFGVWEVRRHAIANDRAFLRTGVLKLMGGPWSSPELDVTFARAQAINDAALPLLREAAQEARPFFLFVNYMDAHEPYVPPAPFDAAFPGRDPGFHHDDYLTLQGEVMAGARVISPAERAHLVSQYDGAIRYVDAQVSALAARLKELGVWDRTMFVVTSDHGEAFGRRGLVGHGTSVYQDQVHVPLVIKYPGRSEPARMVRPVSLVDVLPTVLAAAGLQAPKEVQGSPLESLDESAAHPVFSESFAHSGYRGRFERIERTLVGAGMKLIVSTRGTREMYDLPADPAEAHDVFRSEDPRAQALLAAIEGWIQAIPRTAPELPKLDRETVRRLRALGYLN
jgi:arylsulfatase A-like enzyme